jgi:hypothetical protein
VYLSARSQEHHRFRFESTPTLWVFEDLMIKTTASLLISVWLLTVTAHAQAPSGCYLEPWIANAGDAILTICSNSSIAGCSGNPIIKNASAAGGLAMAGFNLQTDCVTSNVEYIVKTTDVSANHHYNIGLVCHSGTCAAGTLYVQTGFLTGPVFAPSNKANQPVPQRWQAGAGCTSLPCTLPAGIYGLVVASDCTSACAVLYGDADTGAFYAFDVGNVALNSPWATDPVNGLPAFFPNMPAIFPVAQANTTSNLPKPPVVLIY